MKKYIVDEYGIVLSDFKDFRLDVNGISYIIVYGRYINGYFIALPEDGKSCKAAAPWDIFYNRWQLRKNGVDDETAKAIAKAIKELYKDDKED